MIVDIDVKSLGGFVNELNKLIDDYEELQLNLFNQLKMSCSDWHDGNSIVFEEMLKEEKKTSGRFLTALKKNKDVFEYAYIEYKEFGNKIYVNLDKTKAITAAIDAVIAKVDSALYEFYNINRSWYYYELNLINPEQKNLENLKNNLRYMRGQINELCKKIVLIEGAISGKVAKLEEIKASKFSFAFNR